MNKTVSAVQSIQASSERIGDIVVLIDSIAFQTNLLALNAAVEAARAGEHGRGFAVVAGEVRALAQKSTEAAKEIKHLIEESKDRVDIGANLAMESGQMLATMNDMALKVSDTIHEISEASAVQSRGIEQIHHAISQIDAVTQQNAALVEETSAAAESLGYQSGLLAKEMSYFKTEYQLTNRA